MRSVRRAQRVVLAVLGLGVSTLGIAGCSSGPPAAARALCSTVSAAPLPASTLHAVSTSVLRAGEHSGDKALDQAATRWSAALDGQDPTAISDAARQVATSCTRLGIPVGAAVPTG